MIKEGIVSIWLGRFNTLEELQEYLQVGYSGDVDFIVSRFEKDFEIEYFDEEMREVNFLEEPTHEFSGILKGHSFFKGIVSSYTDLFEDELGGEYNSSILLYNFDYKGSKTEVTYRKNLLKFVGSIKFDAKSS